MIQVNEEKTLDVANQIKDQAEKMKQLLTNIENKKMELQKIWVSEASDITQRKIMELKDNCEKVEKEMEIIGDTIIKTIQIIQKQNKMDLQEAQNLCTGD